tara:strand:+ start:1354 stop:1665 length:312 start_codon:yes stop_codon:yes gene_type:complete
MTTNKIQEQLTRKSRAEIKELSDDMVKLMKEFISVKTGEYNYNGIEWRTNRKYDSRTDSFSYETSFLRWREVEQAISNNVEDAFLSKIVDAKTAELLNKLELL